MRKFLLGTAALIALVSPAMSADMRTPVYKAPPPIVPVWSWTACYLGGDAGVATINLAVDSVEDRKELPKALRPIQRYYEYLIKKQ